MNLPINAEIAQLNSTEERRAYLKKLSQDLKDLVKGGEHETVNEAILAMYSTEGDEFHTTFEWNRKGYNVKRGSKAYLIWGKPRELKPEHELKEGEEADTFYPLCFLFSNKQVQPQKARKANKEAA